VAQVVETEFEFVTGRYTAFE
jgi:hypothetical protein